LSNEVSLTTYGCAHLCSQIVYICSYCLNTTTSQCLFKGMCNNCTCIYTLRGLDQGWNQCPTRNVVLYQVLQVSKQ